MNFIYIIYNVYLINFYNKIIIFLYSYLVSNQLTGEASVEAYVRCIQKGCRCIEGKI